MLLIVYKILTPNFVNIEPFGYESIHISSTKKGKKDLRTF
jgi:hypothetical protein